MTKTKLISLVSGLTSRLRRRKHPRKRPETPKSKQLGDMPFDVILEVFLFLDCPDVLRLAQVSRMFHEISQSLAVWRSLTFKLMCRGRRVSLHGHLSTSALSPSQLKQSVLLTSAAEKAWRGASPTHVEGPHTVRLDDVDLDCQSYIMKFTSWRHLVLPTKAGELLGWDTKTSAPAGNFAMGADSVLINVQGDFTTRSLYWIMGKITSDPEHEQSLHIKILRIKFPEPSSSHPVEFDVLGDLVTPWSLAAELHFLDAPNRMICAVFLNDETSTAGLHVVLDWSTGLSYIFDTGIFYEYGRAVIGLHLSDDKKSIILRSEHYGTEIRRAYSISDMRSRAFIWNAASRSPSIMPLLRPAGMDFSYWEHEPLALNTTMAPHTVWVLPQWWPMYPGVPRRTSTIILYLSFADVPVGRGRTRTRRVWRAAQHYSDTVVSAEEGGREVNSSVELLTREGTLAGGAPCSSVRSIVDIGGNAATISLGHHGLPILAQSFNHLGWIEEKVEGQEDEIWEFGERKKKRIWKRLGLGKMRPKKLLASARQRVALLRHPSPVPSPSTTSLPPLPLPPRRTRSLKLVSFPDPGTSPLHPKACKYLRKSHLPRLLQRGRMDECRCTTLTPVTLDVPAAVLDNVYHMFLEPAAGTVTLATEDNELHVYQYGKPAIPPGIVES